MSGKNYFRLSLISTALLFLSGCTSSSGNGFLSSILGDFGVWFVSLIRNPNVVYSLMFFAMFMGTFAMFKGLLRFAFKNSQQFATKERNVIAFMFSFIGTSGIFFLFNTSARMFIVLFGGAFGLIFVLFVTFFIMKFFYDVAEKFKNEKGAVGKGAGWIFLMALGTLFSSYLLFGYSIKVLNELGCSVRADYGSNMTCGNSGTWLFTQLGNIAGTIIGWALIIVVFAGLIWAFSGRGKKENEDSDLDKIDAEGAKVSDMKNLLEKIKKELVVRESDKDRRKQLLRQMEGILKGKIAQRESSRTSSSTASIASGGNIS